MRKITLPIMMLATTFLALPTGSAQAQATRTWVSGVGDDANPCSRTAPCKTFAGAISKTADGGEISVLDPGGFGCVTVTKAITIDGQGQLASIVNAGCSGVIVNAAGKKVVIRNISIMGGGTAPVGGIHGINYLSAAEVVVENVTIEQQANNGINMSLTATGGKLFVNNVTIHNVATGISATTTAGGANVTVNNSRFFGAATQGILAGANANMSISNSVLSGMTTGIAAVTSGQAFVGNSQFFNSVTAVNAGAGTNIRVSNNDFINNTNNFITTGTVSSAGNNRIIGGGGAPNGAPVGTQ
jgi:hypothetical protein